MPDDVLTKLQELAAKPELTKGFPSQQACIAWANKVIPLLSFNIEVQNSFWSYQTNINTIGLSANLQRTSLNQMISLLHSVISEIQEIERYKPKSINDELIEYADVFESICNRFIESNRTLHLSTKDEAFFRQKLFEVISLIKGHLGEKNLYTGNMISALNSGSGQFGPSLHCVQSVRGLILAAQKEVKRKELSKEENQESAMISSNDSKTPDLSSSRIENFSLGNLIKLPIQKLVGLGTVLFALLATSFYFGFNVRTWQTDKSLYDLNKENRELKDRLDRFLKQPALAGLFKIETPDLRKPLPARQQTTIRGTYTNNIPDGYDVRAVLFSNGEFYVLRTQPHWGIDKKWDLTFIPWPGEWKLYLCLTDDNGRKEMVKWANEKKADGSIDWGNARSNLPKGVILNSLFEFSADEKTKIQR